MIINYDKCYEEIIGCCYYIIESFDSFLGIRKGFFVEMLFELIFEG